MPPMVPSTITSSGDALYGKNLGIPMPSDPATQVVSSELPRKTSSANSIKQSTQLRKCVPNFGNVDDNHAASTQSLPKVERQWVCGPRKIL